jgi:glycosyltransferase involved in cell wall biosynthesis
MFSVIVPLYNKRSTVATTVAAALAQSFSGFELIVVDDGSTDCGLSTLQGLDDPRLRLISQANGGAGAARNAGAAAARHDWLAFLDADDVWFESHLEELDRIRRAFPDAGLIGTSFRLGISDGQEAHVRQEGQIRLVDYFEAVSSGRPVLFTSSAAARRDVWHELGGFGSYPTGQDSEFFVRIAARWPVAVSTRVTAAYRQRTGGITDQRKRDAAGKPPRDLADLSPAAARAVELRAEASGPRRKSLDLYLDRYLHWRLRDAVRDGDCATIRALRSLYERPPSTVDRALLLIGTLPGPLARLLYRAGGFR